MNVIFLIVVIFLFIWILGQCNVLIKTKRKCDKSYNQIKEKIKNKYELINNFFQIIKINIPQENLFFESLSEAKNLIDNSNIAENQVIANNLLTNVSVSLIDFAENNAEIKSSEMFIGFQEDLSVINRKISYESQFYNDGVYAFNTAIQVFPISLFAMLFHFTSFEFCNHRL